MQQKNKLVKEKELFFEFEGKYAEKNGIEKNKQIFQIFMHHQMPLTKKR